MGLSYCLRRRNRVRQASPKKEDPILPLALLPPEPSPPRTERAEEEARSSSIRQPLTSPEFRLARPSQQEHLFRNSLASVGSGLFTREEALSQYACGLRLCLKWTG